MNFSLAPSEWVTVGEYTLLYRGLTGKYPTYDLYVGGVPHPGPLPEGEASGRG